MYNIRLTAQKKRLLKEALDDYLVSDPELAQMARLIRQRVKNAKDGDLLEFSGIESRVIVDSLEEFFGEMIMPSLGSPRLVFDAAKGKAVPEEDWTIARDLSLDLSGPKPRAFTHPDAYSKDQPYFIDEEDLLLDYDSGPALLGRN